MAAVTQNQLTGNPGVRGYAQDPSGLPPLLYDYIMKRAVIEYTGHMDVLVFYNQLKNSVEIYGLYLIPVVEFAVGKSLCPEIVQNIRITDDRYKSMAGCLYQKLASHDIIPAEFNSARNIIKTYTEVNDGYKVLYTLIEPLLHRDIIQTPPLEEHWTDIHEYAPKVQSYLNCEAIAGRHYTQKEQVGLFLLECWQGEENGQSIVRAAYKPDYKSDRASKPSGDRRTSTSGDHRQWQPRNGATNDQKCPICHGFGHPKHQCQPFAKYLLCKEADQRMEDSVKLKIIEKYKSDMKQKAETRRKKQQMGTVCQLWDEGRSYDEVEQSLFQTLEGFDETATVASTASDE